MGFADRARALVRRQEGLSTVEYVVLLVLIMAISVGVWNSFGHKVQGKLQHARDKFAKQVK